MSEVEATVLLPTLNSGPLLVRAVKSVLADIEAFPNVTLMIIDGGSTDGSIQELERKVDFPRLTILNPPTGHGIAHDLNFGFERIVSEFTLRMDADDVWCRGRLVSQLSHMKSHPNCVLLGTQTYSLVNGAIVGQSRLPLSHRAIMFNLRKGWHGVAQPTVCFRTQSVLELGGYWDQGLSEDHDLFLRAGSIGEIHNLKDAYLQYSQDVSGLSVDNQLKIRQGIELAVLRAENPALQHLSISEFLSSDTFSKQKIRAVRRARAYSFYRQAMMTKNPVSASRHLIKSAVTAPGLALGHISRYVPSFLR